MCRGEGVLVISVLYMQICPKARTHTTSSNKNNATISDTDGDFLFWRLLQPRFVVSPKLEKMTECIQAYWCISLQSTIKTKLMLKDIVVINEYFFHFILVHRAHSLKQCKVTFHDNWKYEAQ